ncbi:hypothetical protein C0583_03725 [Candidatus Parcubacteria bacterium]|nr:MAG: hypothetical protein C0583_03725 [Candidatus Parcubacteria bacterium]
MKISNKKLIFIVGSGRSGTTLLRNIFILHPETGVVPELKFFSMFWNQRKKYGSFVANKEKIAIRLIRIIQAKATDPLHKEISYDEDKLKKDLLASNSYKEMMLVLGQTVNTDPEKEIIVFKTPSDVYHLAKIFEWFPDALVINVLRDGREVCASARGRGWGKNIFDLALKWNEPVEVFDIFYKRNKKHQKQILNLKFENLINKTEETLTEIFEFVGVSFPDDMLQKLKTLSSNSSFDRDKKSGIYESKNFDRVFNDNEKKTLKGLLYKNLLNHSYDANKEGLGIGERMIYLYHRQRKRFIRCLNNLGINI